MSSFAPRRARQQPTNKGNTEFLPHHQTAHDRRRNHNQHPFQRISLRLHMTFVPNDHLRELPNRRDGIEILRDGLNLPQIHKAPVDDINRLTKVPHRQIDGDVIQRTQRRLPSYPSFPLSLPTHLHLDILRREIQLRQLHVVVARGPFVIRQQPRHFRKQHIPEKKIRNRPLRQRCMKLLSTDLLWW